MDQVKVQWDWSDSVSRGGGGEEEEEEETPPIRTRGSSKILLCLPANAFAPCTDESQSRQSSARSSTQKKSADRSYDHHPGKKYPNKTKPHENHYYPHPSVEHYCYSNVQSYILHIPGKCRTRVPARGRGGRAWAGCAGAGLLACWLRECARRTTHTAQPHRHSKTRWPPPPRTHRTTTSSGLCLIVVVLPLLLLLLLPFLPYFLPSSFLPSSLARESWK